MECNLQKKTESLRYIPDTDSITVNHLYFNFLKKKKLCNLSKFPYLVLESQTLNNSSTQYPQDPVGGISSVFHVTSFPLHRDCQESQK